MPRCVLCGYHFMNDNKREGGSKLIKDARPHGVHGRPIRKSGSFFFFRILQVDRMALIAGLSARMSLVAIVTSLHARPIRSRRKCIVFNVAMTIDAEGFFLGMKLMGNLHNSDILQVRLFSPGEGRMAAKTALVQQVITGRKPAWNDLSGIRVTILASY
jgi:hypothetical protein